MAADTPDDKRIPTDDGPTYRRTTIRRTKAQKAEADQAEARKAEARKAEQAAKGAQSPEASAAPTSTPAAALTPTPRPAPAPQPAVPSGVEAGVDAAVDAAVEPTADARPSLDGDALLAELDGVDPEEFAALLGDAGPSDLEPGDIVSGPIVRVTPNTVFVDLGGKAEAWIARVDLGEDDDLTVGAPLEARVLSAGGGGVRLTRSMGGAASAEALETAMEAGLPVEGRVESRNTGGYVVAIGAVRAFCPISQIDRFPGDADSLDRFIGQSLSFKVLEVRGRDVVVSHRAIQDEEAEVEAERIWGEAAAGDAFDGVVVNVKPYGVFVDIGGVTGLLHKREVGWDENPTLPERGDQVQVRVLEVDRERQRISLSMKDAVAGPWTRVGTDFRVGEVYEGTVVRLAEFGAFVQLAPGLQGLVHISNLSDKHVDHPGDVVKVGEPIKVRLLEADTERERLDLGLKQAAEDWEPGKERRGGRGKPRKAQEHHEGGLGTFADLLGGLKLDR